jgi:Zn finger protein HypA/HybF involved in hydrogenase expression
MCADQHELPTPRTTLRSRYVRVLVWCKSCRHRRDAGLQAVIDAGKGDVPLMELRFRCSNCGSQLTDFVVTATEETGQPR